MKALHSVFAVVCFSLITSTSLAVFGPPVPVPTEVQRPVYGPSLSADELTLYFIYDDGGPNCYNLMYATRPDKNSAFGAPTPVAGINWGALEGHPWIFSDSLAIYYGAGPVGKLDLHVSTRNSTGDPFSGATPLTELNSDKPDVGPSLTRDGLIIVFGSIRDGGLGGADIYMATRPDVNSPFSAPINLIELNSTENDNHPSISPDGKAIFFNTRRREDYSEIWMATRPDLNSPFGAAHRIEEIYVDAVSAYGPCFVGNTLYFGSERDGSLPGNLWMAEFIPESTFATGGGWILPEDCGVNTHPNQRANFGFNVRYKRHLPTGHIEFRSSGGHIDLKSISIENLVITGGRIIQFCGWASVNGQEGNWFSVEAIDNGVPGKGVDTFEINIWSPIDSVYGEPTERVGGVLQGGNITVHIKNIKK